MAFAFDKVKTCFIVGAGASAGLGFFPSFRDRDDVWGLCTSAVARGDGRVPASLYRSWLEWLGDHYNWDLERMYESLTHLPDSVCNGVNTGWIRQWLVREIANRSDAEFEGDDLTPWTEAWKTLLSSHCAGDSKTAVFTTNFDLVLESCLREANCHDGIDGHTYDINNFPEGCIPIVKLHGSANLVRRTLNANCVVERRQPDPLTPAEREACLEPTRRKWPVEEPYARNYDALEQALTSTNLLGVVGFSARDEAVASVLRRALLRRLRGKEAKKRRLKIHVFDKSPYQVEESVRRFLHRSGEGRLNSVLDWEHFVLEGGFPESVQGTTGRERLPLTREVSLASRCKWFLIEGEPRMVRRLGSDRLLFRQDPYTRYFESGRMVLRPTLPAKFCINLSVQIVQHGAGWAPGLSLEDEEGNEVLSLRFIPIMSDPREDPWLLPGEPHVNGLRISSGTEVHDRHEVAAGDTVHIGVRREPGQTTVNIHGRSKYWLLPDWAGPPTRLHLGGFPWYNDEGQCRENAAECIIGPCTIKPL